jgi:hypothetical protein
LRRPWLAGSLLAALFRALAIIVDEQDQQKECADADTKAKTWAAGGAIEGGFD